ncbi:fibrous sheath CABYR-binding protein isoform X2 [Mastomys coucha]|uniref:fibrous sheath CABYR-binding protein isoform X2 n=1 Tax=Mastomys coucha TaxID=35658 RepID=UPI001261F4B9|nr:fibrous sheath CABYR-binding protein isoform X2 [Mastomys coucha]
MEDSEEPEQPISLGRQEYRRRRLPSQPMVDKSQQTELTEKKKAMVAVQPLPPKATHSIGNIPGSKDNYSGKEYESLRLSSQLQQTWMKRKHDQETTDKSFQTDTSGEEKVEVIFIDKTLTLEESTAGVGETAPELPRSIPELGIPTSRPTSHLTDRSQQTSCTGDWNMINIYPKDKVDKEQQTYFSGIEITIRSKPDSSPIKSKEETMPNAQEGSLVEINGSLEIEVQSTEKLPDVMMSFTEGEISGEFQALPADEATVKAELFFTEETPIQAPSPAEETSAAETATTTAKDVVDIQSSPADELSSIEAPADVSPPLAQGDLSDKPSDQQYPQGTEVAPSGLPVEDVVPFSEEVLEKVQAIGIDTRLEDLDRTESTTAEKTTGEVQPPLSEETSKEVPDEVHSPIAPVSGEILIVIDKKFAVDEVFEEDQPPIIEEVSVDKATEEVQPQLAEDVSEEVAPSEVMPPPTEQGIIEDMTAEVPPQQTEEGPAEVPPPPAEEAPVEVPRPTAEEAPAEDPPPPAKEAPVELPPPPAEEGPAEVPPPPTEEGPASAEVSPPPVEKDPAEGLPPSTEETPAQDVPTEVQLSQGKESPAQILPFSGKSPAEETSADVHPSSFEKAPSESLPLEEVVIPQAEEIHLDDLSIQVQPLPAEDIAVGVPAGFQGLSADEYPTRDDISSFEGAPIEENPVEAQLPAVEADIAEDASAVHPLSLAPTGKVPAEIQVLQIDNTPTEVAPVEDQPLPAEEVYPKKVSEEESAAAEVRSPLSEGEPAEVTVEVQLSFVEETPQKASVDVHPPPPETPVEESPVVEQPLKTDVVTMQEFPVEKILAEDSLTPSEQPPADQVLPKEHRLSQVAVISEQELKSLTLTSDKKTEGTDSVPEDVSGTKDDQISTFKIEGEKLMSLLQPHVAEPEQCLFRDGAN